MIDLQSLKKIVTAGELVDKYVVNELKIRFLPDENTCHLPEQQTIIEQMISAYVPSGKEQILADLKSELVNVLECQWRMLDGCFDSNLGESQRMQKAYDAQIINRERQKIKNRINELVDCPLEPKDYGRR